ncbi:MAG: glutamine--fructose-6-phosphate transaminase (isomerizing), partial [Clostridia bacterium]
MCGIVGYIGYEQATPFLLQGLEKLEYRGYDSAGVAVYNNGELNIVKTKGRLKNLVEKTDNGANVVGTLGIGHTRWATHGAPSDLNSHPHPSYRGEFAVVHNGIIENYLEIRGHLQRRGVKFLSETDTEVVAQMLDYYYDGNILDTILKVTEKLDGSYALAIICKDTPEAIYAARKNNPLIIGLGENENYIASDVTATIARTKNIYRLGDDEVAVLTTSSVEVYNSYGEKLNKEVETVDWDITAAEKGGYEHFMMKEIMEQPEVIKKTVLPRIKDGEITLDDVKLSQADIEKINKIFIVACGTSYHVGVAAKYMFEQTLRIPVETDVASEFRYRNPIVDDKTLVVIISQSGETADTLAALREAKEKGARVISVVNVVGSTIANESDDVIYTWAGPEISVASTKAYSTQLVVMYLIGIYMAEKLGKIDSETKKYYLDELMSIPEKVEEILKNKELIQRIAAGHFNADDMYFIGRNVDFAVSLEGCLKLKEISYIHSEAYTAGELKHGPISLIVDGTMVVSLATYERLVDKTLSNIKEVKARGAVCWGITVEGNENIEQETEYTTYLPKIVDFMLPSLSVIPLQLFAYYVASMRGCDIDKPRNL